MNSNIERIYESTEDQNVKKWCEVFFNNPDCTIWEAKFIKKDGSERLMKFDISTTWNKHSGEELSSNGVARVQNAIKNNNLTVIELITLEDGSPSTQCRIVPLTRLLSLTPIF